MEKGGVRRCIENCEEGITQCFSFSAVVNLQGKPGESSAVGLVALDKYFGVAWGISLYGESHVSMSKFVKSL